MEAAVHSDHVAQKLENNVTNLITNISSLKSGALADQTEVEEALLDLKSRPVLSSTQINSSKVD